MSPTIPMSRKPNYPNKARSLDKHVQKELAAAFKRGDFRRLARRIRRVIASSRSDRLIYRISVASQFWNPAKSERPLSLRTLGSMTVARTLDGKLMDGFQTDKL